MTSRSVPLVDRSLAWRRLAASTLCLIGLLCSGRARAQSNPVDLEWDAPSGCPQLEDVQARIRKLAGTRKSSVTPLRAQATVSRNDDGQLHLRLVIRAGNVFGERNIAGKSCEDLAGASAVALVLLLRSPAPLNQDDLLGQPSPAQGPVGSANADGSGSNPLPTAPDEAEQQPKPRVAIAVTERPAEPSSARRAHLLMQLPLAVLGIGPLRQPSLGLALGAGLAIDRWRLLAQGIIWRPQHASTNSAPQQHAATIVQQYGADIQRASVRFLGCRALVLSGFEIAPCAVAGVEHVSARGTGAHIVSNKTAVTWLAIGVAAQARAHVASWLSLLLAVDGQLETSRPQLSVAGAGAVERLFPAAATVTVGSEWIF